MSFTISNTSIPDVKLIVSDLHWDDRGCFAELGRRSEIEEVLEIEFVQHNMSYSHSNVLRGLHFQEAPKEVGKLVRCLHGEIFDVAVDIRPDSPTYKAYVNYYLHSPHTALWIPPGFAHGFCTTSGESAVVLYSQTEYYDSSLDRAIIWNDPDLGIRWPIETPILSDKDADAPLLSELYENQTV